MSKGQITMDQRFGKMLAQSARDSGVIVEFGTHDGSGSTWCLHWGIKAAHQHLYSIDIDKPLQNLARDRYDPRFVTFIHGTIVKPEEFMPFSHPDPDSKQYWAPERDANSNAPYVLDQIPENIDLLLLDGGEWTSHVEFTKLGQRCKMIALDDTDPAKSNKNWRAVAILNTLQWQKIGEDMNERNGWSLFRRPEQLDSPKV